jgi:hypothetical protein
MLKVRMNPAAADAMQWRVGIDVVRAEARLESLLAA